MVPFKPESICSRSCAINICNLYNRMLKVKAISLKWGRDSSGGWAPFFLNSDEHQKGSSRLGMSPLSWKAGCRRKAVGARQRKEGHSLCASLPSS